MEETRNKGRCSKLGETPAQGTEIDLNEPPGDMAMIIHTYQAPQTRAWKPNPYQIDQPHPHLTEQPNPYPATQPFPNQPTMVFPYDNYWPPNQHPITHRREQSQHHIFPNHHLKHYTPKPTDHPMITQLRDSPEPSQPTDHPDLPKPYSHSVCGSAIKYSFTFPFILKIVFSPGLIA